MQISKYCATELKPCTKKVDFLTKKIVCNTWLPFDHAWSGASKKVHVLQSIDQGPEKCESEGAENGRFCMGILVTLSLSLKKAPIGRKKYFC